MATFTKTAILLALALTAGSVFAAAKPTTQTITTLGGKFNFTLPKAYVADTLPVDKAQDGTGVTQGTMYANQTSKSVVIVAETVRNDGIDVQDNDAQFLDGAVAGFVKDQSAALPDFKKLSEKKLTFKGLGLRQVDSTATQGGGQTLNTTLLAGSGTRMALVQVISRASDKSGHEALVKTILKEK